MAEPIFDKASYSLIRTNPKLTTNVKLLTNDIDLYLESFSANTPLASSSFKAFKIDGNLTYDQDVFKFFKKGSLPTEIAYESFQEFQDTSVLPSYENQYEMFYSAGTRAIESESYKEDLGMLAPLWLNEQIPNYFIVFRVNDPISVNNSTAALQDNLEDLAQTSEKFNEFILNNCTAIKTFDLRETSKLGGYLRRYVNQENFPKAPLTVSWRKDDPILWNGISYNNGGFTSAGNLSYDSLVAQDATIIQNEYFFTQGFQRNGVILANLINLEFLFSDISADEYSINRYFGLYVDEVTEGSFKLSGEGFYNSTEKSQLPKIKTINEISEFLNSKLDILNDRGILLHIEENSISTQTGLPTPNRVNEVESIFYVKDKNDQFHTVKKGSQWKENQVRLFDNKIDISLLAGFNKSSTFTGARLVDGLGKATAYLEIKDELPIGSSITFFDGSLQIGQITANESLTSGPGSFFERFFNPKGTPQEIASAINKAIQFGIVEDDRLFNSSINNTTVYLQSRFGGTRFNQLRFVIDWVEYPELGDSITSYPETNLSSPGSFFVGGTDNLNSLLLVNANDQLRFSKGNYVKGVGGFIRISDWIPYLNEPIISSNGNQSGYQNIDDFVVITLDGSQPKISESGQVTLYSAFLPEFGRFSFYPIKDFDFNFYSDMYSNLGELMYESMQYNQIADPLGITGGDIQYEGVSSWPEIRSFYDEGGFSNLIGLLRDSDPDFSFDIDITSEYQRLEENFLKEHAIASRITPYINKWVWYDGGKDVRNNPYRLNLSLAFGVNNFSPSMWNTNRAPDGFSYEWYYMSQFPSYFNSDAIESSWSYFDKTPNDNSIINEKFIPGTFQRIDKNEFNEYFIADRFNINGNINLIDRQLRYGRFSGGDKQNFAEAFLRGVRIIAKNKASIDEKSNFNAKKLSYVFDGKLNGYRFSVMVVPNSPGKPKKQIKIIKNNKWKTIVMLIFISFNERCLSASGNSIDRTSLYSIKSSIETNTDCTKTNPILFNDSIMQGSIDLNASGLSPDGEQLLIRGTSDILGNMTSFFTDIKIGANGQYNSIEFTIGSDVYLIEGITKIISFNQLTATSITKNGIPFSIPSPLPNTVELKNATYILKGGGFNEYLFSLDSINFANIFNDVNEGNPDIIYETIDFDGNQVLAADGSLAQTFSIELRAQDDILKSSYIGVIPDPNKPTIFNLSDVIGYDLSLQTKPKITPISRHSGWFSPLANDVIFFRDPYLNIDFNEGYYTGDIFTGEGTGITGNNISDDLYKFKVFNLCRYKNTQFYSKHKNFGLIKDYFYHKVNQEDPSSVLELSTDNAFLSLYPLINEIGIDYKDYYIFSSNWEPGYFTKSIDKTKIQSVIGTRSMKEKKSFYASKYIKIPNQIVLDTFKPAIFDADAINDPILSDGTFMHKENNDYVEFYLFIEKRITEYLSSFIKPVFKKYINPKFGIGDTATIDDDVNDYIEKNILKLYKIKFVDFYTKQSRENIESVYTTAELTNAEKAGIGLRVDQNVSTKTLNTNQFDLRLIYNKRTGFSNSYGFSITLVKK